MEPINTNANNTEFQEIFDDHLEKVVQDFNEFRERMAQASSCGAVKLEDLIDLYIDNGRENAYSKQHNTQSQGNTLLQDTKFESTPPQHRMQSERMHDFINKTQIEESEMMIQEMTEDTSQNDIGSLLESSQTMNINSQGGIGNKVTYIRYGDLNCHEAVYGIIASVFGGSTVTGLGSVMRFLRTDVGVKENADVTNRRKKVKRKYRGAMETEEETAQRTGITKTMKNEAATKAYANREFLEGNKRIGL